MDPVNSPSFLAHLISDPVWGDLVEYEKKLVYGSDGKVKKDKLNKDVYEKIEHKLYRRYLGAVTSTADYGVNRDTCVKTTVYEVGLRFSKVSDALAPPPPDGIRLDTSYAVAPGLADDFAGFAGKYSNFTARFTKANLAGLVERCAKGLAMASYYDVTSTSLAGGKTVHVTSLGTTIHPVSASASAVFIPRLTDTITAPSTFAVLVAAAAGEGASVVTDIVEVDAASRAPLIPTCGSDAFAQAAVEALRILGSNMIACGEGSLFAYAVTRGIHSVLSVVGHTDEGGTMRDLLRLGSFSAPYGGIHFAAPRYVGLPALTSSEYAHVSALTDGIALASAGLVAHCDPGIYFNGQWFPTVLDGSHGTTQLALSGSGGTGSPQRALSQLIDSTAAFSRLYIRGLGKLFGCEGESRLASEHFAGMVSSIREPPRHLSHASLCPWFWIEPTSIIPADFLSSDAEYAGAASIVGPRAERTLPAFQGALTNHDAFGASTSAAVRMPFLRSSALLMHMHGRPLNGLAHYIPRQLDPEGILHPGADAEVPSVADRVNGGLDIGRYLWVRGQSMFPPPGEFINTGVGMGFEARHLTVDRAGNYTLNNIPSPSHAFTTTVTFRSAPLVGLAPGRICALTKSTQRARTRGLDALRTARSRAAIFGTAESAGMPIRLSAPASIPAIAERPQPSRPSTTGTHAEKPAVVQDAPDDSGLRKTVPAPVTGVLGSQTMPTLLRPPPPPTASTPFARETPLQPEPVATATTAVGEQQ